MPLYAGIKLYLNPLVKTLFKPYEVCGVRVIASAINLLAFNPPQLWVITCADLITWCSSGLWLGSNRIGF